MNLDIILRDFATKIRDAARAEIIAALGARGPHAASPRSSVRRAPVSKSGAKRSPRELQALQTRLHQYVSKNPGQRIEQIGSAMGVATRELNLPVKKLIATKQLVTKGQKRATTYSAR